MIYPYKRTSSSLKPALALLFLLFLLISVSACSNAQTAWLVLDDEPARIQIPIEGETLAELLKVAGYPLGENDRVMVNGVRADPTQPLTAVDGDTIQVRRAYPLVINDDGQQRTLLSSARTIAQALWENNISLSTNDYLSLPSDTVIDGALNIEIRRSNLITILVDGKQITSNASVETVGDALAQAGVTLQNLDYSIPAEQDALPENGEIQVVRVAEEIILLEEVLPYGTEYVADDEMDLDQVKVAEAGQVGLSIARIRVRTENGEEVSRETEESWIARAPVPQTTAYGTKITIQTTSTADGTIEYWRAVTVIANSYHDTGYKTASGKWPTYGMVAVSSSWFSDMQGTSMYVPGYGVAVVEDTCGACSGNMMIDLFIPTDQYVGWHKTVTIYFLTPVPSSIKYVLP